MPVASRAEEKIIELIDDYTSRGWGLSGFSLIGDVATLEFVKDDEIERVLVMGDEVVERERLKVCVRLVEELN